MKEAIEAYKSIVASNEFKEIERLRSKARHDEASALEYAREIEREKWQIVVAEVLAEKDAVVAEVLAEKDAVLAEKDAIIEELKKRLGEKK
jgi:hypothetical protein